MKSSLLVILALSALASAIPTDEKQDRPPHCTQITKDTDYTANFKFDYPPVYIPAGQQDVYQSLHCTNPPTVSQAVTRVCDWAAPPEVQFSMDDDSVIVIRQDPAGRFAGNAVIMTTQKCNHNIPPKFAKKSNISVVAMLK